MDTTALHILEGSRTELLSALALFDAEITRHTDALVSMRAGRADVCAQIVAVEAAIAKLRT